MGHLLIERQPRSPHGDRRTVADNTVMAEILYFLFEIAVLAGLWINFTQNETKSYKPIRAILWVLFIGGLVYGNARFAPEDCEPQYDLRGSRGCM